MPYLDWNLGRGYFYIFYTHSQFGNWQLEDDFKIAVEMES